MGRALCALTPDGEAELDGAAFQVRAQAEAIGPGQPVLVTGLDPWSLTVREATPEEAAGPVRLSTSSAGATSTTVLWVVGAVLVGCLFVLSGVVAFVTGGLVGVGFLMALAGQAWLLGLIARECQRGALFLALVVPFFAWLVAWKRWEVAKWPCLVIVLGVVAQMLGIMWDF